MTKYYYPTLPLLIRLSLLDLRQDLIIVGLTELNHIVRQSPAQSNSVHARHEVDHSLPLSHPTGSQHRHRHSPRPTRGGIQPDEIGQLQCRRHQRKHGASKICPFSRHRKHSAYERPGAHYAPAIAEAQDTSRRVQTTMRRRRPRLWHAWGQKLCGGYASSRLRASGRGLPPSSP